MKLTRSQSADPVLQRPAERPAQPGAGLTLERHSAPPPTAGNPARPCPVPPNHATAPGPALVPPRRSRDLLPPGAETLGAGGLTALAAGGFFIPHLPLIGASFVCASAVGGAAYLLQDARERLNYWQGRTFTHRHFTFLRIDQGQANAAALQAHYAAQVAAGSYSGAIEADALGKVTGTHIALYDRAPLPARALKRHFLQVANRGPWRALAGVGMPPGPGTPEVALAYLSLGHYRALIKRPVGDGAWVWQAVECGGGGDCLFHSMRYALQQQKLASGNASAADLRALTARRIAVDPAFADERIASQTSNAWFEYQEAHAFARGKS